MGHAGVAAIQTHLCRVLEQIVVVVEIFKPADGLRQLSDHLLRKPQHLARLAHGAAAAIRDHIGRHGGPAFPIPRVDMLDDALALFPGRKIEVDVGPFPPLLGEKPLEEQVHPDRIDGRNAKRVTDSRVGGRASALAQDAAAPGKFDQVPNDQKVAFQLELADHRQLVVDLAQCPGAMRQSAIALGRAAQGLRTQV